jgi:hypothetical protein
MHCYHALLFFTHSISIISTYRIQLLEVETKRSSSRRISEADANQVCINIGRCLYIRTITYTRIYVYLYIHVYTRTHISEANQVSVNIGRSELCLLFSLFCNFYYKMNVPHRTISIGIIRILIAMKSLWSVCLMIMHSSMAIKIFEAFRIIIFANII